MQVHLNNDLIPGDTWIPVACLPVGLNPHTGEWIPVADLLEHWEKHNTQIKAEQGEKDAH